MQSVALLELWSSIAGIHIRQGFRPQVRLVLAVSDFWSDSDHFKWKLASTASPQLQTQLLTPLLTLKRTEFRLKHLLGNLHR